ncbi:MAG: putative metal-binding motif-containing protein [Patescibacteria group bacterium]
MKTMSAVVIAVFAVLTGCGNEADGVQTNEIADVGADTPAKHDMRFPEADAGQTENDGGETDQGTDTDTTSPCKIVLYFPDADGDGYGDAMMGIAASCEGHYFPGWATEAGDCRDTNPNVYPGALEICNNRDDDCNMIVDDNCTTDCAYKADGTLAKNQGISECATTDGYNPRFGNWVCRNNELYCDING